MKHLLKVFSLLFLFIFQGCLEGGAVDGQGSNNDNSFQVKIFPEVGTVTPNQALQFYGFNGIPPYTFRMKLGQNTVGVVNAATGLFTASSAISGNGVLSVTDSTGAEAVAVIFLVPQLTITPHVLSMTAEGVQAFAASGGSPPYAYNVQNGLGTITPVTGLFTAASTPGTVIIRVTDNNGAVAESVVTVISKPSYAPSTHSVGLGTFKDLTITGGIPPFNYVIESGAGGGISIPTASNTTVVRFTASGTTGTTVILATDFYGKSTRATINTFTLNQIASGDKFNCIIIGILTSNNVKCWGENTFGQLGYGHTVSIGTDSNDLAGSLGKVPLGYSPSVYARTITAGHNHVCTLTNSPVIGQQVKCWGQNTFGQLGVGDTNHRGDNGGEVGALSYLLFGTGNVVRQVSSGGHFNCALVVSATRRVKCWGDNSDGQLGLGDTNNRGGDPNEMDNFLPLVNLGTSGSAIVEVTKITTGDKHACALLTSNKVKCWGNNTYGQLGLGDTNHRGDGPSEMGDFLDYVDLVDAMGNPLEIIDIAAGSNHTCALARDGLLKCWGDNTYGQLGINNSLAPFDRIGDASSEMGLFQSFSYINNLATDVVWAGYNRTCAKSSAGDLRCWGENTDYQLGQGHNDNIGTHVFPISNLPKINLSTSRFVGHVSLGLDFTCVVRDDNNSVCFGQNDQGQLGIGSTTPVTNPSSQFGDFFQTVNHGL